MSYHIISSKCLKLPARRVSAIFAEDLNLHQRRCRKFRYQNISARTCNADIRQLVMKPLRCVETTDTDHETTRRHVPEKRNASNARPRKPKTSLFNLFAGIPWSRVKSRCHARSDRRDQFRSSRCWHVCRTCGPQPSERWHCDVTVVW